MHFSGDAVVLRQLFENEEALRHGHKPPHRILLIGTGGGMCCIRAAGYLTAFRELGLEHAIDHAVTVSGAGGAMGAYLSGMPHRASQMFELLGATGFIEAAKFKPPKLRLQYLADVLRGQHSPLAFNDDLIRSHRTSWHAVVTRLSGESLLVDTKKFNPDAAEAVLASSALPQVADPILARIGDTDEEPLVDGACGMPLPVSAGVMKFRPSTILILESRPTPNSLPRMERLLWPTMTHFCLRHSPKVLRKQTASMAQMIKLESDRLARLKRIKWCRVSPNNSAINLSPFTIDPFVLRRAAEEARSYMHELLIQATPARQI